MRLKPVGEQAVVIVGASSGIGRETALRFARQGAKVVVAARREDALQSLVAEIAAAKGQAVYAVADITQPTQVQNIAKVALAAFGRIDTWVNVASVVQYAPFADLTPDEWRQVIDVDLNGQAYGAMAALPHLRKQGGALIFVSSVIAERGFPLVSGYSAAKAGVRGLVEALRAEMLHDGAPVSVTQIKPASINTPLFNHARTNLGVMPRPAPPVYEPSIVADAIIHAAAHPVRDVYAGDAAWAMLLPQRVSPRLMDYLLSGMGYRTQQTNIPKGRDAPDNLFAPTATPATPAGEFGKTATTVSVYNRLVEHPGLRYALVGAVIGAGAVWLARRRS